jgi:hypothetical protein
VLLLQAVCLGRVAVGGHDGADKAGAGQGVQPGDGEEGAREGSGEVGAAGLGRVEARLGERGHAARAQGIGPAGDETGEVRRAALGHGSEAPGGLHADKPGSKKRIRTASTPLANTRSSNNLYGVGCKERRKAFCSTSVVPCSCSCRAADARGSRAARCSAPPRPP